MIANRMKTKISPAALLIGLGIIPTAWAQADTQDHIAPPMVNIPAGDFMMGTESGDAQAKPRHRISLPAFQMAKYPVTVAEFRKFVQGTGYTPAANCVDHLDENWLGGPDDVGTARWDQHRYTGSDYLPVTCISWQDANAYADWLSDRQGIRYRLPTEQEFEYALKAHTTSRYFWGDDPQMTQACRYGNFADQSGEYHASREYGASYVGFLEHANCDDGEAYNAIVGLYRPNPFGLYDMVGNVSQYLATCYYDGYQQRSEAEMNTDNCEYIAHRGGTWHYPPQPHADRGRAKRVEPGTDALMGFRLVADGRSDGSHASTRQFEKALKQAQQERLATRPRLPAAPRHVQLVQVSDNHYRLSWQPSADPRITGYEIYQSTSPQAHLLGQFYQRYYKKISTLDATGHTLEVTLPATGGSFRVVSVADKLTSLPSDAAAIAGITPVTLPGTIAMQNATALENVRLAHRKASEKRPELYYLSKLNKGLEQPGVTATFDVEVEESAWYTLNYRLRTGKTGKLFKLWQGNRLIGDFDYDPAIDDKTSTRHKVFLNQGTQQLQVSVMGEGWDYWSMVWLKFTKVES